MKSQGSKNTLFDLKKKSDEVSILLKQLSHPQRLLILCSLSQGELTVSAIEKASGASQSAVSQFLKNMRLEGLVDSRRDGKQIYYRISDERIHELMNSLFKIFCG